VWGCTLTSLRKPTTKLVAKRPLTLKSPVTTLTSLGQPTTKLGTKKRHLELKSPVTKEEGFRFFWSAYKGKLPSDLDDLQKLPQIWFSGWSPLLPLLVLLKYRPVRDECGTQLLMMLVRAAIYCNFTVATKKVRGRLSAACVACPLNQGSLPRAAAGCSQVRCRWRAAKDEPMDSALREGHVEMPWLPGGLPVAGRSASNRCRSFPGSCRHNGNG